jgi:hypothetical protein
MKKTMKERIFMKFLKKETVYTFEVELTSRNKFNEIRPTKEKRIIRTVNGEWAGADGLLSHQQIEEIKLQIQKYKGSK